jgi:hypothetical protein
MSSRSRNKRMRRATHQTLSSARQRVAPSRPTPPPPQRVTITIELWKSELPAFASAVDEASNVIGTRATVSATLAQEQAITHAASAFGKLRAALADTPRDLNFVAADETEGN